MRNEPNRTERLGLSAEIAEFLRDPLEDSRWITVANAVSMFVVKEGVIRGRVERGLLASKKLKVRGKLTLHVDESEVAVQFFRRSQIGLTDHIHDANNNQLITQQKPSTDQALPSPNSPDYVTHFLAAVVGGIATGLSTELFSLFRNFLTKHTKGATGNESTEALFEQFDAQYAGDPITAKMQLIRIRDWEAAGKKTTVWASSQLLKTKSRDSFDLATADRIMSEWCSQFLVRAGSIESRVREEIRQHQKDTAQRQGLFTLIFQSSSDRAAAKKQDNDWRLRGATLKDRIGRLLEDNSLESAIRRGSSLETERHLRSLSIEEMEFLEQLRRVSKVQLKLRELLQLLDAATT